jgi:hypothetical protein
VLVVAHSLRQPSITVVAGHASVVACCRHVQHAHQRVSPVFGLRLKYDLCDLYEGPAVLLCTEYQLNFNTYSDLVGHGYQITAAYVTLMTLVCAVRMPSRLRPLQPCRIKLLRQLCDSKAVTVALIAAQRQRSCLRVSHDMPESFSPVSDRSSAGVSERLGR